MLEGAQGLLLSIEFGSYPYVTSSDCSLNGTATGVGLPASIVDIAFNVVKFPFMTRVGAGPFPTELGGAKAEEYCAAGTQHDLRYELATYGIPFEEIKDRIKYDHSHPKIIDLMNSSDDFIKGVGIRLSAEEYGATTSRPRRTGWTDLLALRYAVHVNGPNIIITKPDSLKGIKEFKLCNGYNGSFFSADSSNLKNLDPEFEIFEGFNEDISGIRKYEELPKGLRESIEFLEKFTGGRVRIVSVGPEREQTIVKG